MAFYVTNTQDGAGWRRMPERSSKGPYTLNKKPHAGFLGKASNPIDPACKAVRPVRGAEGWRRAGSECARRALHASGKLNHVTFFITHEITRCQYPSHSLPDYCCLRSCQSSPAILPAKFTQSYLQAVLSPLITLRHSDGTEMGK